MTHTPQITERRPHWLRVLASSPAASLRERAEPVLKDYRFEWLRAPQAALLMLRSRIGNTGDRFNLGEATVTRCAVRWQPPVGEPLAGVGHVLGRDAGHVTQVAQLDALLQSPLLHDLLWASVVEPLQQALDERRRAERERAEATRVRFFTLQAELQP